MLHSLESDLHWSYSYYVVSVLAYGYLILTSWITKSMLLAKLFYHSNELCHFEWYVHNIGSSFFDNSVLVHVTGGVEGIMTLLWSSNESI